MTRWTVIVPSNRPEEVKKFIGAWSELFDKHKVKVVLVWDLAKIPYPLGTEVISLCWQDLDQSDFKFIPKKTDMIRSFGFWWAYKNTDSPYFLTLDDDVRPGALDPFEEYEKVFAEGSVLSEYLDVGSLTTSGLQMRGFPYKDRKKREVAVQYGGWDGVLDYDAATQLSTPKSEQFFDDIVIPVPKGAACTCCIMNCAWQREYTPIMWQLPLLEGRYNRVGDIWSGLFIKKTLDAIGAVMVINGRATVDHERASNPYNSLVKEAPSVSLNDELWEILPTKLESAEMLPAYKEVLLSASKLFIDKDDLAYAEHFVDAAVEWLDHFE